jgi:hypothetical protein
VDRRQRDADDLAGARDPGSHGVLADDRAWSLVFPSSQQAELNAYLQKFLIGGGTGNTSVMRNDPNVPFNSGLWINWTVPNLSGSL